MADPGMLSQVLGLVGQGMSPQEAKTALEQARLMEMARLTPVQQTYYGTAEAGGRLAGGLGRLLGGGQEEDAMLRKASAFASMRNQIDPTDPKSLAAASKQMYQMGYTAQGDMYAKAALEAETKRAKIRLDEASIEAKGAEKLTPEQKNAADIVSKTPGILAGSPQWMAAYKKELERLTTKEGGKINYGAETERISKAQFNKPYSELTLEQAAKVDKIVEQRDLSSSAAKASKPVDVASIIKEIGTKEDIKGKSEAWKNAGDAYKTQVPMIEKLKEVRNNLPATFTGSFSETALQFGKALSAFGVPVDENKLSNTEYMNSVSSQVLQTIARNFPGSLAVKEMDQLVKSKFSSPQQIKTISRILSDLQTEIEAGTKSYEQLAKLPETERYSKDLNLLTGQNFTKLKRYRALEDKGRAAMKSGQPMSKAEVEEAKKLQQELGA